ncbi:leu/phe-tRNA-protein transferase [Erythrobacter sp. NAP1]|uniref:leucyl/phenylalanyl-tRNA--protein transferase n=1 Tax=Erythrobacter sp. NAP1 TaxID=237727 RepID=UPI000068768F|nr:leucyl/phenylalanyl-tRNA--protein transferase [Erythrobacter sp. NAP1]EAQ28971.1 leu/phe-tRNA-protein transferase [Erythrobacter sp. NAP1]
MHSPLRATIPVETLLLAYRSGIFPMADKREDQDIFWVEPRDRAIIPLSGLHVSKSLRKVLRSDRFEVTHNEAFTEVMRACAAPRPGHPESWISERIVASYTGLHRAGHAHSLECWLTGDAGERRLVGGLYGVSFDKVFCGESMFSLASNASKVALCWLVAMLREAGYQLLDCQFMTDHLASMGAVEMPQKDYLALVEKARGEAELSLDVTYQRFAHGDPYNPDYSSPGKLIAQSLTQTS